mmetsp:Transcript_33413/g.30403  ORF Transcript_33413/g.30403 Transcript_33413/m.30403 type:complete len:163 (+) Transcript_33413:2990-3478(+)
MMSNSKRSVEDDAALQQKFITMQQEVQKWKLKYAELEKKFNQNLNQDISKLHAEIDIWKEYSISAKDKATRLDKENIMLQNEMRQCLPPMRLSSDKCEFFVDPFPNHQKEPLLVSFIYQMELMKFDKPEDKQTFKRKFLMNIGKYIASYKSLLGYCRTINEA